MYKCIAAVVFVAAFGCVVGVQSQALVVPHYCLGCLCEAVSNCNHTRVCSGDICGLLHITQPYWADGGKHTQQGESPDAPQAFVNCVTVPSCAERTVQGYMAKYQQDCNLDGKIDCLDYVLIHKLGGYGCRGTLPEPFETKINRCLAQVGYHK